MAALALGLLVLSAPAGDLAAALTATSSPAPAPVAAPRAVALPAPAAVVTRPAPVEPPVVATGPAPVGGLRVEVPQPMVPVGVVPELDPRPDDPCSAYGSPTRIVPAVEPAGPGAVRLSWRADSAPEVRGYRVQAVEQSALPGRRAAPPQVVVGQPGGCAVVGATVAGLTPGARYVFWLEEEVTDSLSARWVQVGTSEPVTVG
ncbi:hypothetical protein [Geodermatophilus marinus]|uniref:hypothetical protein n=1 Tax=Geodermatophilus sp. LHW52908 TaxID=2303986 RepID=UPI000E3C20D9|nr:hypothetical protein [Geodermatophilus sp. LHW52908]RFU19250.1 hypothetical protein D0Z06_22420 [Geodermatophilus sp. LHW52908]